MRWVLRLGLAGLWIYGLLELGAYAALWSVQKQRPAHGALIAQANEAAGIEGREQRPANTADHIRHPYLAFAPKPAARTKNPRLLLLSSMALASPDSPLYDDEALVVGLSGGSVAAGIFNYGGEAFLQRLESSPQLAGRQVHLFSFAVAGLKQPQQAVGLAYLMAAGVRFDAMVNLDGFNEVALTTDPGAKQGGFPAYPYQWSSRMALTSVAQSLAGELGYLERTRAESASAYLECPARWSPMRKLAWAFTDRRLEKRQANILESLREQVRAKADPLAKFELLGPGRPKRTQAELQGELAAIWERGSRALSDLCQGRGIPYVHALQPNQYDPAFDKPMGPSEHKLALNEAGLWAAPARSGYPLLRAAAARLAADGIDVLDLKGLFAGVEDARLRDDCCHFNAAGNIAIAEALADALLAAGFPASDE